MTLEMPDVGLGVYQMRMADCERASYYAITECGYQHIDTAEVYHNEEAVGRAMQRAIKEGKTTRDKIFITTKAGPASHGKANIVAACERSLKNLQTDYIDLYLIHWPGVGGLQKTDTKNKTIREESWESMEQLTHVRNIGVSNYTVEHLRSFFESSEKRKPFCNQIELHPFLQQREIVEYCEDHGVVVTAYSSLVQGLAFGNGVVVEIARRKKMTESMVLLQWALQKNYKIIPKSTHEDRIRDNISIYNNNNTKEKKNNNNNKEKKNNDFVLDEWMMEQLDGLDCNKRVCWDPTTIP